MIPLFAGNNLVNQSVMNSLLASLGLLAAITSFEGKGNAFFARSGSSRICSSIHLRFEWATNYFQLFDGGYDCEDLAAGFDPFRLEFQGDRVLSEGKVVGVKGENFLNLNYENLNEGFTYQWRLKKLPDGTIEYSEKWLEGTDLSLAVYGNLSLVR